jgi:flagellar biosynthesis protein FlhA
MAWATWLTRALRNSDLMIALAILVVVTMLILPMPKWMLDTFIVFNFAASIVIALMAVNITNPLQFSVFPALLLVTTLFRLALSIVATKLILGTGSAGKVIETFGQFVVGGDFVVGVVAFLILVVVQFVVITNGAGRVAEVAARFTLDAMPGKQMAIDADLNAGLIDQAEAKRRRRAIELEADFYGAMDGASKFVKGDAIAAILIILINIIGGFAVGFLRGQGDAMTVLQTYTLLTVGEGLVAQIPALLISTATGLLVTRASTEQAMGQDVVGQVLQYPRVLMAAGAALAFLSIVPGFPSRSFFSSARRCSGWAIWQREPTFCLHLQSLKSPKRPPRRPHRSRSRAAYAEGGCHRTGNRLWADAAGRPEPEGRPAGAHRRNQAAVGDRLGFRDAVGARAG